MKRILHDNIGHDGTLDNDKVTLALLQYRNTPIRDIGLSPAQILLHRQLRDGVPTNPMYYQPHPEWIVTAEKREQLLSTPNMTQEKRYNIGTRELRNLDVGTNVVIQSRQGRRRWNKTGRIVECLPHRQYRVKVNGSGRITFQNRKFLRPDTVTRAQPRSLHPDVPIVHAKSSTDSQTDPPDSESTQHSPGPSDPVSDSSGQFPTQFPTPPVHRPPGHHRKFNEH